jgi:hypothetical protein
MDFVGKRVQHELIRIKAEVLGGDVPPAEPAICQVVPISVDKDAVPEHVKQIEFYGYNFDHARDVRVIQGQGFSSGCAGGDKDVTAQLDRPTHYAMTLKFGTTGVQLDQCTERMTLQYNGQTISTVAVVQTPLPVCITKVDQISPTQVTFTPPKVSGDGDFFGHGPHVVVRVTLVTQPQSIFAQVFMSAREQPRGDGSVAEGAKDFPLYTPAPGWIIQGVPIQMATSEHEYTSNVVDIIEKFGMGSGGPVQTFLVVGDTQGNEVGTRTKVDVLFNPMKVELRQTSGCRP